MPELYSGARMRRHDLVWIEASTPLAQLQVAEPWPPVLQDWLRQRRPLVVGRQPELAGERLRLGFTLPGRGPRSRVEVHAPRATITRHTPAPLLCDLQTHAPVAWQAAIAALLAAFAAQGTQLRVYGSLVNQAYSGEACLREDSDLDLLIDCRDRAEALASLALLQAHAATPHLDGELRLAGWAVAWRELARVLDDGPQAELLVRSDTAVQRMGVAAWLAS